MELLYAANQLLFQDPCTLIHFTRRIPFSRTQCLRQIVLRWNIRAPSILSAGPVLITLWTDLFHCLSPLGNPRSLKVNIYGERACDPQEWLRNLAWLEAIKEVTVPPDFQLLLPIDAPKLDLDTSPSCCQILGHLHTPSWRLIPSDECLQVSLGRG